MTSRYVLTIIEEGDEGRVRDFAQEIADEYGVSVEVVKEDDTSVVPFFVSHAPAKRQRR